MTPVDIVVTSFTKVIQERDKEIQQLSETIAKLKAENKALKVEVESLSIFTLRGDDILVSSKSTFPHTQRVRLTRPTAQEVEDYYNK